MTKQAIIDKASKRVNNTTGKVGQLLRTDVIDALKEYPDQKKKKENITDFLSGITFLTHQEKQSIINDVDSYINV